jgi:hypothetical protein
MQQPLFTPEGELNANANSLQDALRDHPGTFSALGSAPFLEVNADLATRNMLFIFGLANDHRLHVDFHLDYNLAEGEGSDNVNISAWRDSMIQEALGMVEGHMGDNVTTDNDDDEEVRTLTIGHGIRLSLLSDEALSNLQDSISRARRRAPVYLVALPPCDVFTKGRNLGGEFDKCRATLNVVKLTQKYGIEIAMAVGNVQNNFAPQGSEDPLALCPIGVMLYQTAGEDDTRILLVSPGSRYQFLKPDYTQLTPYIFQTLQ